MKRIEDQPLITGAGVYVADLIDSSTLHAAFVRSPLAHGHLTSIDLSQARAAPGVIAAFDAGGLDLPDIPVAEGRGPGNPRMGRPPLAKEKVRFMGEAVAVVIATSAGEAAEAAELVWPQIEPLSAVTDFDEALTDRVLLFPEAGTNVVLSRSTESTPPITDPDEINVTVSVLSPRLAPLPIEPLGIVALPEAPDSLRVFCGHQAPHRLRNQLAQLLQLDSSRVRVSVPDVGGAFGMKGALYPEYLVVAAAALRLGRPVAWIEGRREGLASGIHGRGQQHRVTLAGSSDGRIRKASIEIGADVGAYPHSGIHVPLISGWMAPGLYDFEEVSVTTTVAVTNKAPTGSYRGAGRPEATLAIERAVDAFARRIGLDPIAVRRRNMLTANQLPFRSATGAIYDSGDYPAALDIAVELIDVDAVRMKQADRRRMGADPIGLGISAFVERAGGPVDSGEYSRVEVGEDGRVTVRTGSTSAGQGHRTVWAQVVAKELTVPLDRVEVVSGDTGEVAQGVGSYASRSAQVGASAAHRMAVAVRDRLQEVVSEHLEISPADLEMQENAFVVRGSPEIRVDLGRASALAMEKGIEPASEELFVPNAQTFPYGVHAAVIEIELETGAVKPLRIVTVDDCGQVINPMVVEGQLHGSLMQGLGAALYEEVVYGEDGQLLTGSLAAYNIPAATVNLPLTSTRLTHPAPSNPLGVKGAGEVGCIGLPAAILNAVIDALAPWGVSTLQLPLTPVKVWTAIRRSRKDRVGSAP